MKITLLTGKTYDIETAVGFPLKVVKSPRAKRLTLRIDQQERLPVLTLPNRCTAKRAVEFVLSYKEWIEQALSKIPETRKFTHGDEICFFGRTLKIVHTPRRRCGVMEEDGSFCVSGSAEFLHRRVKDYLKKQACIELWKRSKQAAEQIGCRLNDVTIKDTKSRWGSCSSLHNINYNWRISLAPECVISYMVAHEVSHLKHQDHSRAFWKCVKELYPQAEEGKNWLRRYGKELYSYE